MSIDLTKIYDLITGHQPQEVPHERLIALITFSSWLHWPAEPDTVLDAQITAGALIVVALTEGVLAPLVSREQDIARIVATYMPPSKAASMIVKKDHDRFDFASEHEGHFVDMNLAEAQASFLLQVPTSLKPSLNKAQFFLDNRGYDRPLVNKMYDYYESASPTTSKRAWSRFSKAAPFLLAARLCNASQIDELAPDNLNSIKMSEQFPPGKMQEIFRVTLTVQNRLSTILKSTGVKNLKFQKLPTYLDPQEIALPAFTAPQLELLKTYRAPKAI